MVVKTEEFDRKHINRLKKLPLKSDICFRASVKLCSPEEKSTYMAIIADAVCGRQTGPFHHVESQKDLRTVSGAKSIMPDLFGYDENDESWCVEMQNDELEDGRRDVYRSHIVLDRMPMGKKYSFLKKGHMIVLTDATSLPGLKGPLFVPGQPVMNIQEVDSFTGRIIPGKMEIRLFNLRYEGTDAAGDLAHDLRQSDPQKIRNGFLKMLLKRIQSTEKGEKAMCEVSREIFGEGVQIGRKEGRKEGQMKSAQGLLQMGLLTLQQIAQATSLSVSEVQKLQSELKA